MTGKLDGKSALITGAASGAGLTAARALAAAGCTLHLADANESDLETEARNLEEDFEVEIEIHPEDLCETVNIGSLALECDEVDILICASGALPVGTVDDLGDDDWRDGWNLAFFSAITLIREILESQCDRGRGLIAVLMTGSLESDEDDICRSTANAALSTVIRALGVSAAKKGVCVVGIHADEPDGFEGLGELLDELLSSTSPEAGGSVLTLEKSTAGV
ncbi:MAG: SDR family NAD(P)-dependent oxidoreductase [Rhodospirillales bacterium]|nr:SDR family NAD(P)-dependent oxidoreductase [Rhodospirillales bacterium]